MGIDFVSRREASTDRAATQGKMARPRVIGRQGFHARYKTVLERLVQGDLSRRRAAKELGIGYATLKRLLDRQRQIPGREPEA